MLQCPVCVHSCAMSCVRYETVMQVLLITQLFSICAISCVCYETAAYAGFANNTALLKAALFHVPYTLWYTFDFLH